MRIFYGMNGEGKYWGTMARYRVQYCHLKQENHYHLGEIGEIVVKGPQVMKGYWNKPEETAACTSRWLALYR